MGVCGRQEVESGVSRKHLLRGVNLDVSEVNRQAGGERRAGSGGQSLASTSRPEKKLYFCGIINVQLTPHSSRLLRSPTPTVGGCFFCLFFFECIQAMITLTSARGREQRESHGLITALITTCSRADGGFLSVTSCEERVSGIEQHETGSRKKNNNKQTNNKGSLCCTRSCQYF